MRSALLALSATLGAAVLLASCAEGTECNFHSQCDRGHYCMDNRCWQDCQIPEDCDPGEVCNVRIGRCEMPDGRVPLADGGRMDAFVPPADSGPTPTDAGRDAFVPPVDSGPSPDAGPRDAGPATGTGGYLDRCTGDGECASGLCTDDVGGSRFCSRTCTGHSVCADEHVCDGERCVPDDTGEPCSTATPETCNLGLCLGPSGGSGACTRDCASASDCPAGYACTSVGGSFVCVDIEKPCSGASDCLTGLCLSVQGCTASCRTAADCPARLDGLPAYTCEVAFGSSSPICVPPSDVSGSDPAGALCRYSGGYNLCRSGICDDGATPGPTCTQACTPEGGCGPGLGCFPLADGGSILLVCSRAGSKALGETCASGSECDSALCDATSGRCTRFCADGLCPTGWSCETVAGFGVAICRPG